MICSAGWDFALLPEVCSKEGVFLPSVSTSSSLDGAPTGSFSRGSLVARGVIFTHALERPLASYSLPSCQGPND